MREPGPGPAGVAALLLLAGCAVGPNYRRPGAPLPPAGALPPGWTVGAPRDHLPRGAWWRVFDDPALDRLERQVAISNQTVAQAEAQYRQARALVRVARAAYFPTVTANAAATRAHRPAGAFGAATGTGAATGASGTAGPGAGTFNTFSLEGDISWELDVWGRVRRNVESSRASAQASAADLESVRLSAQAELAQSYLQLRTLDAQQELLAATVRAYEESLQLTRERFQSGVAARTDLLQAQAQLETARAQEVDLGVQRAQLEHAIAVLVGRPATGFTLARAPLRATPPVIPTGLPTELLQRRPDIAGAERRMQAANAQIGVAVAAYFPSLTLSASGGFAGGSVADWFAWPSRLWSLGVALAGTIFQGGLRHAQVAQARAAYDAQVAGYRETVLTAFQEVEDNLAALRILADEARVQEHAIAVAAAALELTLDQYRSGTVAYLNVIVAQTTLFNARLAAVNVLGRRMTAAVLLVKAVGGGWDAADLPRR